MATPVRLPRVLHHNVRRSLVAAIIPTSKAGELRIGQERFHSNAFEILPANVQRRPNTSIRREVTTEMSTRHTSPLLHNQHNTTKNDHPTSISRYCNSHISNFRQSFHTTSSLSRDHHFDTLKFVQRLQSEGFSESQSQAILRVLNDAISESIQNLTRTMVLREDALKTSYTQKVDFSALRTELLSMDSAESSVTRAQHERLTNELQKLSNRLRDEVQRTQASVRLDLNLEKGRIREETGVQELRIKETETRIEQEVAALRERVEGVKFSTLQWLMGVCTGTAALILGAWRLLM